VLGRLVKVEELNYDATVYSTTNYTYDALDQLTEIDQAGLKRTFDYDGHGRLASRTTPEQGKTDYTYFADDAVQKVTDARGVTTTFAYNARHLPTTVTYNVTAATGVAATPNVTYAYDAAGNRTSMVEKNSGGTLVGSSSYHYDDLGRMDWEERFFQAAGTYRLSYGYNLAGQLTGMTAPSQFGSFQVGYAYDKVGRPTSVTNTGYGDVNNYVNSYVTGISYRAFGAARQIAYGDTLTLSTGYDTRLRLNKWDLPGTDLRWTYYYSTTAIPEKTGRVAFANNLADGTLDRSYSYDHVGRLTGAHTGNEANSHAGFTGALPSGYTPTGPSSENYSYDQFGNMTWRNGWGAPGAQYARDPQINAKNQMTVNPVAAVDPVTQAPKPMTYDAAGNLTNDGEQTFTYNAQGQQATAGGVTSLSQTYDGDGLRIKKTETPAGSQTGTTTYYLRSSVLGKRVVLEIGGTAPDTGAMLRGYVYLGGQMLAIQKGGQVSWVHQDPVTKSQRLTDNTGEVVSTIDLDPWGGETGRSEFQTKQPHRYTTYERDANGGDEAMFRRYESKLPRFSQPDPYEGSYNLSDPQSFNRYAYVGNDPVNFVDPLGLCTFNITINNSANVNEDTLRAMRNEIARIFLASGNSVVFNNPSAANGGSYSTTLLSADPVGDTLAYTNSVVGGPITSSGGIYIGALRNPSDTSFGALAGHSANLGRAAGRVGAHEVGHYLLQISKSQHTADGLMRAQFRADRTLYQSGSARSFLFSPQQALQLRNSCPIEERPLNMNTNPIPTRPLTERSIVLRDPGPPMDYFDWVLASMGWPWPDNSDGEEELY
jgi:RHS repeat-associated protein